MRAGIGGGVLGGSSGWLWTWLCGNPLTTITYLTITTLLAVWLAWYIRRRTMVSLINKLPGPPGIPVLGNALQITIDNLDLFHLVNSWSDYGPIVKLWIGSIPLVLVSAPNTAEALLSSSRHIEKSDDYEYLHPWLGTGLLTASGSKWHSRRKMLTPAFHFKILEDFVEIFDRQARKMVDKLSEEADGGALFDVLPYIARCTLDIICETAMGHTVNAQDQKESEYVKAVKKINYLMQRRMTVIWQQPTIMYWLLGYAKQVEECLAVLHGFSRSTIQQRKIQFYQEKKEKMAAGQNEMVGNGPGRKKKKPMAFLDLLLEASDEGKGLTDEDIREEVDTFMFEGHDTTAAGINWCVYILGRHPEIQAKVHEELDRIFKDSDRPVTMTDLREMRYTENCIKEALRLFPSVPYIGRHLKEDMDICGHHIPAGSSVMLSTYRLHRDPEQFPDPEKYDPDRFLPENVAKRHPFAYVPFSAGPRNCIGQKFALMEEKIVMSQILRNYRIESDTPRDQLQLLGELILRTKNGNHVRIYTRDASVNRATEE